MLSPVSVLFAHRVDPAVWGFVQANALKAQVVAIGVTINRVEDSEGFFRKIFGGWNAVQHNRLVIRNGFQEVDHGMIAGIHQKRVVPMIDQVFLGQRFDLGEIHYHAVGRVARLENDVAAQCNFDSIAMAVQMTALAFMVRDAMACIKLEATGNKH